MPKLIAMGRSVHFRVGASRQAVQRRSTSTELGLTTWSGEPINWLAGRSTYGMGPSIRYGRACAGHPHRAEKSKEAVTRNFGAVIDGRDKPGHDGWRAPSERTTSHPFATKHNLALPVITWLAEIPAHRIAALIGRHPGRNRRG
jgi:hypothetical protein